MELGAFSVSFPVKDIKKSKESYEKLGFVDFVGDIAWNWIIMKSGSCVIGLFQGFIEKTSLHSTLAGIRMRKKLNSSQT